MPEMYSERHQVDRNPKSQGRVPAQGREADSLRSGWEGSGERRPPAKPGPSTGGGEGREEGPLGGITEVFPRF